jgi:hypothetical protein
MAGGRMSDQTPLAVYFIVLGALFALFFKILGSWTADFHQKTFSYRPFGQYSEKMSQGAFLAGGLGLLVFGILALLRVIKIQGHM